MSVLLLYIRYCFRFENVYIIPQFESDDKVKCLPFDQCIPAIMDLVQQDLFGVASEMKEVEYVEKQLVKEA